MTEGFRMRSERNLVQIPEARLVVVRVRHLVQLVPLDELLQRGALRAAALHIRDEAVLEGDLPPRVETAVADRPGDDAVDPRDRFARQPLLLERGVVDERIAEPPR